MELWRYDGAVTKLNTTAKRGFVGVRKAANADDDQVVLKVLHVDAANAQPARLDATVLYALWSPSCLASGLSSFYSYSSHFVG